MAEQSINAYGGLPACRRLVTAHNEEGRSEFRTLPALSYRDRGGYGIARNYAVSAVPTSMQHDLDISRYNTDSEDSECSLTLGGIQVVVTNGLNFLTVDMGPSAYTPMHRTVSIDFVVVTQGEVELELDSGQCTTLRAGETVVQRATMHRWRNRSRTEPCRFVAVVAAADAQEIAGQQLTQEYRND